MSETKATMKIDIPGVDFGQLARETIAARFAESMVGQEEVIRSIVLRAMEAKVNERGQQSQYSYENKQSYIEWMVHDLIRAAALDVLKAKVEALRPSIEKAIEKELARNTKSVAKALTESFLEEIGVPVCHAVEIA